MADDAQGNGSTSGTISDGNGGTPGTGAASGTPSNEFIVPPLKTETSTATAAKLEVPAEYADTPWAKNLLGAEDPTAALWKNYANLQPLLGKKYVAGPPEGATPEQVKEYREAAGVPVEATGYEFPTEIKYEKPEHEAIGKALADSRSPEVIAGLKSIFHDLNIPAGTAKALIERHDKLIAEHEATRQAAHLEAQNTAYAKLMADRFGTQSKEVQARTMESLKKHMPAELIPSIDGMTNEQQIALSVWAESMRKEYGRPDTFNQQTGNQGGEDFNSLRQDRMKLLDKREKMIQSGKARGPEYDQVSKEIDEVNKRMGAYNK